MKPRKNYCSGDKLTATIGDETFTGVVIPLSTFGPLNPKEYVAFRSSDGKAHLTLRRNIIPCK